MRDTVEIIREQSKTEREVWVLEIFRFPVVHLRVYAKQTRPTPRHKWRDQVTYHRLSQDRYTDHGLRLRAEPELPPDVLADGSVLGCSCVRAMEGYMMSRVVTARGLPVRLSEVQYRMLLDVRKDGKRKYNGRARRTIEILESLGLVTSSYSFRFAGLSGRTVDEYTVTAVPS